MPPIWQYTLAQKFNVLLENGVHLVNVVGEVGLNLTFIDTHISTFAGFFTHRTTPYFINFRSYSDDINFKVPPIWQHILERKFNNLRENGVHLVNIVGEGGLKFTFIDTHFRKFSKFFINKICQSGCRQPKI